MKRIAFTITLLLCLQHVKAQEIINRLKDELTASNDSTRLNILDSLSIYYLFCSNKTDSSYFYANESIQTSFYLNNKKHLILAYSRMGAYFFFVAKYGAALQILNKGISLSRQENFYDYLSGLYVTIAEVYTFLYEYNRAQFFIQKTSSYLRYSKDPFYNIPAQTFIEYSYNYLFMGNMDSASYFLNKTNASFQSHMDLVSEDQYLEGMVMLKTGLKQYDEAMQYWLKAQNAVIKNNDHQTFDFLHYQHAIIFQKTHRFKEAITQAKLSLNAAQSINDLFFMVNISRLISDCYDSIGKNDSTLFYLKLNSDYYAQFNNSRNISDVEAAAFSDQLHAQEIHTEKIFEKEQDNNRLRLFGFIIGIIILLSISVIMWRNNVNRKKAFAVLEKQKAEIELQKSKVETALTELKSTQAQLIQSEKMASLGELTAGIAHEIQNPLNFVNNFSEVNIELIEELKTKNEKLKIEDDEIKELLGNLTDNEEKINHHGKRADAIVKGMLQHSRKNSGQKEPADINALCDEYLRLSFHGMRAKDKNFNADFKTDFDESIGKINIVPQDIGRVLLNLFNNAFYAVSKPSNSLKGEQYKPLVSVITKKIKLASNNAATNSPSGDGGIEITVTDNGNGIPQNIIDKIFQPFFTTKPTGQGTGLGLSLAYDIITKEHNGTIKVESKEGEGTAFIIQLSV